MRADHRTPMRVAAATLLAAVVTGCGPPLASQHEFFSPLGDNAGQIRARTRHVVSHHRALQAAQHACGPRSTGVVPPDEAGPRDGPNLRHEAAREALAGVCVAPDRRSVAAYGAGAKAYRRWAEGQVRGLTGAAASGATTGGS